MVISRIFLTLPISSPAVLHIEICCIQSNVLLSCDVSHHFQQEFSVFNLTLIYFMQTINFKRSEETIHLEHNPAVGGIVIQRLVARFTFQFLLDLALKSFLLLCFFVYNK